VLEKLPLLLLVLASSRVTYYAQRAGGAMADEGQLSLAARLENAGNSYCQYISKMFVPRNMGVLYMLPPYHQDLQKAEQELERVRKSPQASRPELAKAEEDLQTAQQELQKYVWRTSAEWLGLALVTLAAVAAACYGRRYLAVGWLWYVGTLVPVIGLVQVGDQSLADRYTYVPMLGLFLMAAWAAGELINRTMAGRAALVSLATVVSLAVVAACVLLTRHQLGFWRDTQTALDHAIEVDCRNCKAHNNLGVAFWEWKDLQEKRARLLDVDPAKREEAAECRRKADEYKEGALKHWDIGLKLQATDPYTNANLGHIKFEEAQKLEERLRSGERLTEAERARMTERAAKLIADAVECVNRAIQYRAILPEPHNTLGRILWHQGKLPEAAFQFREALKYNGGLMAARDNLTKLLIVQKKFDEAAEEVKTMLSLNENYAGAWVCKGQIAEAVGRKDEALDAWQHAVRLDPNNIVLQNTLAVAYWQQGKRAEAAPHFRAVLRLAPQNAAANAENLGRAFYEQHQPDEAARAWTFMAWSLATSPLDAVRNGAKAVELAQYAVKLSGGNSARAMDALAAAHAETRQFGDALRVAKQALSQAQKEGDPALAQAIEGRISLYQQGRPFREPWEGL
jgi:tetratricopeptide (TPR) repeat protein